jgi:hypothetical protein
LCLTSIFSSKQPCACVCLAAVEIMAGA